MIHRDLKEGELVLRKITLAVEKNKLTPKWEGPFRIVEKVGRGAYRLEHLEGRRVPRTWNASSLRSTITARKDPSVEATRSKTGGPRDRPGVPRVEATRPKTGGPRDRPGVPRV
ncbi:hypothetical protein CR513_34907, partial [Mucuna pruriens]